MNPWWPSYVGISAEVDPARWVSDSLLPWAKDGLRLGSILPPDFDAYARLLHPPEGQGDGNLSWKQAAQDRGVALTPETSFLELRTEEEHASGWPAEGELPEVEGLVLVDVLRMFTDTASTCWYCVWDGWGGWTYPTVTYSVDPADPDPPSSGQIRTWGFKESFRRSKEFEKETAHIERVQIPNRTYFLFLGDLSAATRTFGLDDSGPRPSMWWPDDHSWFVHTEIDAQSTYVAGSRACVDALLENERLEMLETSYPSRFAG